MAVIPNIFGLADWRRQQWGQRGDGFTDMCAVSTNAALHAYVLTSHLHGLVPSGLEASGMWAEGNCNKSFGRVKMVIVIFVTGTKKIGSSSFRYFPFFLLFSYLFMTFSASLFFLSFFFKNSFFQ